MSQRALFPFFHRLRVRYSEIDAQGIVFNAHYLTFFDTALTEFMRAAGFDYVNLVAETGADFHVVHAAVDFKQPVRWDEQIDIGCRVAKVGNTSLRFGLGVFGADDEVLRASGEIVWVFTDQKTHQPVAVPPVFTNRLQTFAQSQQITE